MFSWTEDVPTVPGWYWHKGRATQPELVQVSWYDKTNGICCVHDMFSTWTCEEIGGQWAGPVTPPQ